MIPRRISNPRARGRRGSAGGGALRPAAIAFLAVTLLLLSPHQGAGYFPITSSGVSLSWNGADQPVTYVIQSAGSGDIPDESDDLALRLAFRRWEDSSGSSIAFLEDTSADANRTDFGAFDIHLILFDESNQTGYFPGGSTVVALTPITFNLATGRIVDADILFNGGANSFSTDKTPGTFDIQSVATHEIGHFIGLDHGASCASTMFPFAALARVRQRSLTDDDRGGARHIYSGGPATGTISGTLVRQSNGTPVAGAHLVAVNSDGVVATGTYSEANGAFAIAQLPTGSYTVYAEPLDGPVAGSNLSSTIGASAATDFGTTYVGGNSSPSSIVVIASTVSSIGNFGVLGPSGNNLTSCSDNPVLATRGASTVFAAIGTGLGATDTLAITGPGITIDNSSYFNAGGVEWHQVDITTAANAPLGPRNLEVTALSGDLTLLTATLEVVDPPPAVTNINPPDGPHTGGTTVTITGTGYQTGAIVLFGDREADQVTVDSALQITAVTAATSQSGAVDLHIENPDGQLAVAVSGFTYTAQPAISSVYPTAGAAAGGTELTVYGSDFTSGATITVGGTSASIVSIGPTEIRCVAPAGVQGPADLGVANPGGLSDTLVGGFTYLAASDPSIASVSPASGGAGGGTVVSIAGAGFEAGARVFFGAGGAGIGVQGTGISVESASLVTATTPAHAVGSADAWVENPTGAAARLPGGFTFLGSSGGGGGGCFAVAPMLPPSGRAGAMGALLPLFFLMLLVAALRAVRRAPGSRSLPVEKRISP